MSCLFCDGDRNPLYRYDLISEKIEKVGEEEIGMPLICQTCLNNGNKIRIFHRKIIEKWL